MLPPRLLARFARVALVAGRIRVGYPFLRASILRLSFLQSTHFDQAALEAVTDLAADGTLDLDTLVDDVVSIDEAVRVYDTLRDDPMSLGGTVFDWGLSANVSYAHVFFLGAEVTGDEAFPGAYDAAADLVSFGIAYQQPADE